MAGFTEEWLRQRNAEVLGISHCGCPVNGPHSVKCPTIMGDMARMEADAALPQDLRPEWLFQEEATRLLQEDGWRALRTDPVSDRKRGTGFGEAGMADMLFLRYTPPVAASYGGFKADASVLWVELKSAKGKPQKHQLSWHEKERARGALTLIAGVDFHASVAGFQQWYKQSGLMRRAQWW